MKRLFCKIGLPLFVFLFMVTFILDARDNSVSIEFQYSVEINSEKQETVEGTIHNNTRHKINDIILTVEQPEEWTVTIQPQSIESVPAYSSVSVSIDFTAPRTLFKDQHYVTVTATSPSFDKITESIQVIGQPPAGFWMIIGIIIGSAITIIFILIYIYLNKKESK